MIAFVIRVWWCFFLWLVGTNVLLIMYAVLHLPLPSLYYWGRFGNSFLCTVWVHLLWNLTICTFLLGNRTESRHSAWCSKYSSWVAFADISFLRCTRALVGLCASDNHCSQRSGYVRVHVSTREATQINQSNRCSNESKMKVFGIGKVCLEITNNASGKGTKWKIKKYCVCGFSKCLHFPLHVTVLVALQLVAWLPSFALLSVSSPP